MQITRSSPQLTLAAARVLAAGAFAEAERQGCAIIVAVVDGGGHLLLLERGQGAMLGSLEVARRKAECAVYFGLSTELLAGAAQANPALAQLPHMLAFAGGLPVLADGEMVGGLGVSGAQPDQDLACAHAALAALNPPA